MGQNNPNYMAMGNYGMATPAYQPMAPFAMTQPAPVSDWRSPYAPQAFSLGAPTQADWSSPYVPQTRSFAVGAPAQSGFNYETDMAGLMPTSAPLGQINYTGAVTPPSAQRGLMDSFLQQRNTDGTTSGGYGQAALGVLQGVGGLYLGMKQYGLAKDALAFQKDSFAKQYETQKTLTNSRLEDRQRARVSANAGAYQSVGDYMNQNGVK